MKKYIPLYGRVTQLGPDPPHVVDVLLHVEVSLPHQPVPSHGVLRGRGLRRGSSWSLW